jgi:rod shape-determining protein MreC
MPIKVVVQRFAFVLLAAAAVALMLFNKSNTGAVERFKTVIFDAASPVLEVLSQPAITINRVMEEAQFLIQLHDENGRLREENARLKHWQATALRLQQQHAGLTALLNARQDPTSTFISARVIGDSGGPFVRTVLLNAGSRDGVAKGQAAINGDGLVGRVAEVGMRSSRILLLTDLNSRVPAILEPSRDRGVLEGDNTNILRLSYLPASVQMSPGDRVVTSGHGGVFPAELPIGTVTSIADGVAYVQPFVQFHRLDYVRVVRHNFALPPNREVAEKRAWPSPGSSYRPNR